MIWTSSRVDGDLRVHDLYFGFLYHAASQQRSARLSQKSAAGGPRNMPQNAGAAAVIRW